ncbi:MAG TPA: hypothetical protein VGY54_11765, partial [Polyangiaceae bacterium]|nr:hypothetical protein [Polyangiaceae bacterium]
MPSPSASSAEGCTFYSAERRHPMKMSNDHVLVGAVLLVGDARSLKVVRAGNFFNRGHDDSRAERRGFEVGARRLGVV